MPTTKRMRRHAHNRNQIVEGTTRWQLLLFGIAFFEDGPGFKDAGEERAAWLQHRDELMRICEPGQRPVAFFKFDLGLHDIIHRKIDQLRTLLDAGLIDEQEAMRCENSIAELNPKQSPALCSVFERPAEIQSTQLGPSTLRGLVTEFCVFARFHLWRNRPELAARWELRAETIRKFLGGTA